MANVGRSRPPQLALFWISERSMIILESQTVSGSATCGLVLFSSGIEFGCSVGLCFEVFPSEFLGFCGPCHPHLHVAARAVFKLNRVEFKLYVS